MHTLARIIALTDRDELKVVQVVNKTLTVTNGHILVRRFIDMPDGYYYPSSGQLTKIPTVHWFPDMSHLEDRVNRAQVVGEWSVEDRAKFVQLCHEGRIHDDRITLDGAGGWIDRKLALDQTLYDDEGNYLGEQETRVDGYAFQTGMPYPLRFPSDQMVIALNELAKYDGVKVLIDPQGDPSPLILGLNWGSCVIIMPYGHRYGRMQDDLNRSA